ncbi:4-diphosphocytidyl-2-C-methyl-D-erythritol kinase [Bradyrhizobium diazoefficiens USDA 110]|uniref:4-diphosphocytidyl-2-C-methyl-D-erythritol kinase n=3 Tax=Bradyrhizobium diazoefficiens TaxID=1355477 RepID=ISPE_BRADU|nr:RecName: Full=4-diphosphocytidyl-2-C-methyl-D-erythritol kinase; Short=CMK; AltName: Full=4-(cytidine-5'-diphospho)-2-C-methyl-D-erythritol kinase [Bradyrhizobium diazoefficiens USDA 110]PDT63812.1 4-diphosphocytidyl-2C-methyl-D-erythritol kinase [Bradyrhizobium diazoefficiens]QBP21353.1 4-(cytidine 5'-diphospho)-2-C-methyl-D-erythritol kinase [Bradyrhizobium diazoefficiens]BAC47791.1 4-diphosphocytidyl-2-C-methyl-D-erythritol kinase [Bradyrhizobium diazoefficiens USDA 110]BAR59549.1 4-dipho
MSPMPALIEEGRAKVNLSLRVVGRRADGYHDLESVVAFADCADRLTLEPGGELKLATTGPLAAACGDTADNLVFKAAKLLAEAVPNLKLGAFALDKVLPVAAGIGGGSADAAAALRLLARLNNLSLDDPRLQKVALATGADVPVCLYSRACDMTGVGEQLLPLALPSMPCVMVNPRVPVATKDVFQALGLRNGELLVGATSVIGAPAWPEEGASIADWVEVLETVANDLEAPAMRIEPVIGEVLEALRDSAGVKLARMSGSGATCFAIYGAPAEAHAAAEKIRRDHPGWWVHAGTLS